MTILLEEMRADWKFWLKKPEIGILHKYAMRGRMFTVAYASKNDMHLLLNFSANYYHYSFIISRSIIKSLQQNYFALKLT